MNINTQSDFLTNLNRMFDNHPINKNCVDEAEREAQREKFISRAIEMRDRGLGDITEMAKITGSFFREFSNVTLPGPDYSHPARLEALSKRYVEMRDELSEMFADNEDEFYRQMEKMNMAFQQALNNTCLTPIYSFKQPTFEMRAFTQDQESERIRWQAEAEKKWAESEQYNKNVQSIMANFRENLLRHTNTFYESFINSIQKNNYDTAFQESMELLKNSETTSYNEISYTDMVRIMDILNNVPTEFDKEGTPIKMRYNSADESFWALLKDDSVPYSVQKEIADRFGFYIKEEDDFQNCSLIVNNKPITDRASNVSGSVRLFHDSSAIDKTKLPAKKQQETIRVVYINPQGERILKITSDKGTRHIKIGHVKDVFWTEPMITE